MNFSAHGKCILAGEHGVVRGREALAAPLLSRSLRLQLEPGPMEITGPFQDPLRLALERAAALTGSVISGKFTVESDIPPGAGLGSSAALSVAVARLFPGDPFRLAMELENIFHGSSSGIDVAAVLSRGPILFRKGSRPEPIAPAWMPGFFLSDSGLRSSTKACVEKVSSLNRPDLDDQMEEAVRAMKKALEKEETHGELAEAMEKAAEVFRSWGLIPAPVETKIQELRSSGALAVKPTGSGDGGFLLSLWNAPPPEALKLIPIWDS